MMINSILGKSLIFVFLLCFTSYSFAQDDYWKSCPIGSPLASFDFSKGVFDKKNDGSITWYGAHGGIQPVDNTSLTGIKFTYKAEHPLGDATSEWRYDINIPLSNSWEYISIYQPKNFYHRSGVEVMLLDEIDTDLWLAGDKVESSSGASAIVSLSRNKKLFLTDVTARYRKNWGENIRIKNLRSGAEVYSQDSKGIVSNNKFSTQWEGDYSNSGMTLETVAVPPSEGGKFGYSYFRPTINRSAEHPMNGSIGNQLINRGKAVAFDPKDNGTIVSFVIERSRASGPGSNDGAYRIWKKTIDSDWHLVFENKQLNIYQKNNNFTSGYVFGWSNSGYNENTEFYLLKWALWAEKPTFIP